MVCFKNNSLFSDWLIISYSQSNSENWLIIVTRLLNENTTNFNDKYCEFNKVCDIRVD